MPHGRACPRAHGSGRMSKACAPARRLAPGGWRPSLRAGAPRCPVGAGESKPGSVARLPFWPERGCVRSRRVRHRAFRARREVARRTIMTWCPAVVQGLEYCWQPGAVRSAQALGYLAQPETCDEAEETRCARDEGDRAHWRELDCLFPEHVMSCRSRAVCTSYDRMQAPYLRRHSQTRSSRRGDLEQPLEGEHRV